MDSATARVKRAKKLVATASSMVDDALVRQEEALAEEAEALAELAALAAEATRADARPAAQLGSAVVLALQQSKELMEELERHALGSGAPPEEI
eukprot:7653052-Heterocapsa_arctica.AAC.1